MISEELKGKIRGVVAAVQTTFGEDETLDLETHQSHIRYWIEGGMRTGKGALIVAGGGGEGPFLRDREWKEVVRSACEAANGELPIIAGIRGGSTRAVIEDAAFAGKSGAIGIQLSPPQYYAHPLPDVFNFYKEISESVDIGIMVYNTWWHGLDMPPEFISELADLKHIAAVKWSTSSSDGFVGMWHFADKLNVLSNGGLWATCFLLGGVGFISLTGDYYPQYDLHVLELLKAGRYEEATALQINVARVKETRRKVYHRTAGEGSIKKAAMAIMGRSAGPTRRPTRPYTPDEMEELRNLMAEAGMPVKLSAAEARALGVPDAGLPKVVSEVRTD